MSETTPPTPTTTPTEQNLTPEQRRMVIGIGVSALLAGVVIVVAVIWMALPGNERFTATIRDIFIILMALESLFIGLALIVLMIQIARLTNLLQHEIKPILQNTNETVNTVRGTAVFISENLVDPVMKLNGYIAAIGKFFELINVVTKK